MPFRWFHGLATRKELIHAFEHRTASLGGVFPTQVPLVLAIFAAEDGDLMRAQSILGSALDDSRGKPFEKTEGASPIGWQSLSNPRDRD